MVEAGADGIFAEAAYDLPTYSRFTATLKVPVLANITEFGQTPLFTVEELRSAGVAMALYPLSAFRAMNKAAESVYEAIRRDGSQKAVRLTRCRRASSSTTASATTRSRANWTNSTRNASSHKPAQV